MQFSRIRLENWRNFAEVDVPVSTRVFLVGANASGKSNFLDALRFLRDLVSTGGGFQSAVLDRGGVSTIRNLAARQNPHIAVDVELSEGELGDGERPLWRYRLVFNQVSIRNRQPILSEEKIWDSKGDLILDRPNEDDRGDGTRLEQTLLEQVFANKEFRGIADFFRLIKYSHIVPQLVRDPDRKTGLTNDPFGSDFLEQIATANVKTRDARLRRIRNALKAVAPGFSRIELVRDKRGVPHLRGKYEHWRKRGAWQKESEFSDGSLRLTGVMWAMQDGTGPLLLEEPELSLHPEVVRLLPQMMYRLQRASKKALRQVFVSTHSLEMLQDEGIGAHEILLLNASNEGTAIRVGSEDTEIRHEIEAGVSVADVAMAQTSPPKLQQLVLGL